MRLLPFDLKQMKRHLVFISCISGDPEGIALTHIVKSFDL